MSKPTEKHIYRVRRKPFWPWLLGFAALCAALCCAALAWLWGALQRYEAATPEAAILRCVQAVQQGRAQGEPPAPLALSRFEGQDVYWAAARQLLEGLPASRDALRFFKKGEQEPLRYTVQDEDGSGVDFVLHPQGEGWQAWPVVQPLAPVTVQAEGSAQVFVNGQPLGGAEQAQQAAVPGFEAMGEQAPQLWTYRLEGLLEPPAVTAQSGGQACRVEWLTPLQAQVSAAPAGEAQTQLTAFFEKTARLYAQYVSNDASFEALRPLLVADTEFYHGLRTFDAHWYVLHDSVAFEELSVDGLQMFGENAASGTVRFTYVVYKQGLRPRSYPSVYRMHAVRGQGGWQLLNLQVQ